jgi:hypothetical protein
MTHVPIENSTAQQRLQKEGTDGVFSHRNISKLFALKRFLFLIEGVKDSHLNLDQRIIYSFIRYIEVF